MSDNLGEEGKQPPKLECPPGWALAPLATIANVSLGKTPGKSDYRSEGKCKIVKYRDLGDDRQIDWSNSEKGFVNCNNARAMNLRSLSPGDVLISASAHSSEIIGRKVLYVHQLPDDFDSIYYVGEILCIRVARDVAPDLPKLLNYFFQSINGYKSIQAKVHGVHLIGSRAAEMIVPIPPRAAQQRIVSKIEDLFSRIEESERALERVQKLVELYRQSVLNAAVTGELTRKWREKYKGKLESGEALRARILKARREAWEKAELNKMKAKGITPADNKWRQKYVEPVSPDISDLPELPQGWVWIAMDAVTRDFITGPFGSALHKSDYITNGIPLINPINLRGGSIRPDASVTVSRETLHRLNRYELAVGDIVLARRGEMGRCAPVTDLEAGWMCGTGSAILRCTSSALPAYIALAISSGHSRAFLEDNCAGTTMHNLNQVAMSRMPIPIPTINEQTVVLDALTTQLGNAEAFQVACAAERTRISALRQSVLREAFCGALIPQDASDEPAALLLERIAADLGKEPAKPKRSAQSTKSNPREQ